MSMPRTIEEVRAKIEEQVDLMGPYSHNIVGLILKSVTREHGHEVANDLVDEFDLITIFKINKVSEW